MEHQDYDTLDSLHYEVEDSLLKLIKMLQEKQTKGGWQDSFVLKDGSQDYWANVDVDDMNRMAE